MSVGFFFKWFESCRCGTTWACVLPVEGCVSSTAVGIRPPDSDWVTVSLHLTEETEPHLGAKRTLFPFF